MSTTNSTSTAQGSQDGAGSRTVLVTGASRGWGRAIANRFSIPGSTLFLNYVHDEGAAQEVAAEVRKADCKAVVVRADMGEADDVDRLFDTIGKEADGLDVVVHNAFHLIHSDPLSTRPEDWMRAMEVGPLALMRVAQTATPLMKGRRGRIVATSSVATTRIFHPTQGLGYFPMAVAKGAIEVSVRYLATALAPTGITVNAVAAAYIETPNLQAAPEKFLRAIEQKTPIGRIPTAQEMANSVFLLASPDADIVTGQILVVDGGFTLV
jgi:enoyl-[acyl-carrier protein] reductase III